MPNSKSNDSNSDPYAVPEDSTSNQDDTLKRRLDLFRVATASIFCGFLGSVFFAEYFRSVGAPTGQGVAFGVCGVVGLLISIVTPFGWQPWHPKP